MAEWYMASWNDSVRAIRARSSWAFSSIITPTNCLRAAAIVLRLHRRYRRRGLPLPGRLGTRRRCMPMLRTVPSPLDSICSWSPLSLPRGRLL